MAGLLSHGLAAMAFCAFLASLIGLPAISYGVFAAGFFAMLIELDFDELSPNNRTPITHSIFFGLIWVVIFAIVVWGISGLGIIPSVFATQLTLAIVSAYTTHLLIDSFTKEGIYIMPKGTDLKRWIRGLSRGETETWGYWRQFRIEKISKRNVSRANDDPILNACISLPSLLVIILFVASMPMPA
jgi:hypothetical protein